MKKHQTIPDGGTFYKITALKSFKVMKDENRPRSQREEVRCGSAQGPRTASQRRRLSGGWGWGAAQSAVPPVAGGIVPTFSS